MNAVSAVMNIRVAPSRGRGLKPITIQGQNDRPKVAPSRGRGLKRLQAGQRAYPRRRPFTGAWIETFHRRRHGRPIEVAPSRGRGLKQTWVLVPWRFFPVAPSRGRGLKPMKTNPRSHGNCRPFTGAWIETFVFQPISVQCKKSPLHGGVD